MYKNPNCDEKTQVFILKSIETVWRAVRGEKIGTGKMNSQPLEKTKKNSGGKDYGYNRSKGVDGIDGVRRW